MERLWAVIKKIFLGIYFIIIFVLGLAVVAGAVWAHKWWLNQIWSSEITWGIYLWLAGTLCVLAMVGCIIHCVVEKDWSEMILRLGSVCAIALGALAILPFVLRFVVWEWYDTGTEAIFEENWYNPLAWVQCWLIQMEAMGWLKLSIMSIMALVLLIFLLKRNWGDWEWVFYSIMFVCGILWFAPILVYIIGELLFVILKMLLIVGELFDLLAPQ